MLAEGDTTYSNEMLLTSKDKSAAKNNSDIETNIDSFKKMEDRND